MSDGNVDLAQSLAEQYPVVRLLPDDSYAALLPLIFTTSVVMGLDRWGFAKRYCYTHRADAERALFELKSEDDEPTGWIARRDRSLPKDTNDE